MMGFPKMYPVQSSRGPNPRPSNFNENCAPTLPITSPMFRFYPAEPASRLEGLLRRREHDVSWTLFAVRSQGQNDNLPVPPTLS